MRHKILVVEDEPAVRALLKDILEAAGYEVVTVSRGKGAPDLAAKEAPHAILLDLVLPDMDGVEICRRLKANERTKLVPVVMMSGFNIDLSTAIDAGAEDIVYKPFNMADLLLRVRSIIAVRHLAGRDERLRAYQEELKKGGNVR